MGMAIECVIMDMTVRVDLVMVPLGLFFLTLVLLAYGAVLHFVFHEMSETTEVLLFADSQLSISICMMNFVITTYLLEREPVPMNAYHVRTAQVLLRMAMFYSVQQVPKTRSVRNVNYPRDRRPLPGSEEFWLLLPSAVLAFTDAAFYSMQFLTQVRNFLHLWPPRRFLWGEIAHWDFPFTRLIIFNAVFLHHMWHFQSVTAFLYVQPFLYFTIAWATWGRDSWKHSMVMYGTTLAFATSCSYYSGSMTPYLVVLLDIIWKPVTHLG